jgi:hypothetical protein
VIAERIEMKAKLTFWVTLLVSITLCIILLSMVGALLSGLFMPNSVIDNKDIFPILAPAFSTIVGGFIGLLAGVKLSHDDSEDTPC